MPIAFITTWITRGRRNVIRGWSCTGPLQAVLLLDLARREDPRRVKKLAYRALRPIFHTDRFTVNGMRDGSDKAELWIADAAGNLAMTATAHF